MSQSHHFVLPTIPSGVRQFFFLLSHGLRAPLTSIRWASNQLRKEKKGDLTSKQLDLCNMIHQQAEQLSKAVESLMLFTRVGQGAYIIKHQNIELSSLLKYVSNEVEEHTEPTVDVTVSCKKEIRLQSDKTVLESILRNLLGACVHSLHAKHRELDVHAKIKDDMCHMYIDASLVIALLHKHENNDGLLHCTDKQEGIGGSSGLLFSVASELVKVLNGSIVIETIKKDEHRITMKIPVEPSR